MIGLAALLFGSILGVVLSQSEPIQRRFVDSRADLAARCEQWAALCRAADDRLTTKVFGHGLGTVPWLASVAYDHPLRPAELLTSPEGETLLRLRPGKKVYVEQGVGRRSQGPWEFRALLRTSGTAQLHTYVCEKTLFDSFHCVESSFAAGTLWNSIAWTIDVEKLLQSGKFLFSCPVTFAFSVSGEGWVDIRNVRLVDANGEPLLKNPDFQAGSARWFFTSDDHSTWRAENVWLHLYLEQGWLGVVAFVWLVAATLMLLAAREAVRQGPSRYVLGVAVVGFLAVGTFGSLLDTPWITQLLCIVIAAAQVRDARAHAAV
jgi:hypothetical protein